jgi:outer membrane immunogenic protein
VEESVVNAGIGRLIFVTAIVACAAGSARAADLPMAPTPDYRAPAVVVAQVYNWTGIYLGINGGYAIGQSTPMSLYSDSFSAFNYNADGWIGGLTAGAQIQSGHTVIGIEGDIDWANITGSSQGNIFFNGGAIGTATLSSTVNSISTLRTRIGYAADNWLFYVGGGLAVTNEQSNLTGAIGFICGTGAANNPPCSSLTNLHLGLSAGLGVEYGITPNLSAKAEWVWVGAGAFNTLNENMLRAGLNWRFGM